MKYRDLGAQSTAHTAKWRRQFVLSLDDELLVDEFACGGGISEAIEQAIGRHVDISVNHDDDACSMHRINHPQTEHFCTDVFGKEVAPRLVTRGRPVGLLHMSPDCTDHSQAKGGQPRSRKLRALSWIGIRWAGQAQRLDDPDAWFQGRAFCSLPAGAGRALHHGWMPSRGRGA